MANQSEYFILLQLFGHCSLRIKNPDQDLSDLIDDCERFVLWSFDGIKQSAMHIYHSALPWTSTSSSIRQLYEHALRMEAKLVNTVDPTWDACIRIIPVAVGENVKAVVFSPSSGALIAAHGECCIKVFDAMTGVNQATFNEEKFISCVAFSPDDGFLVSGLWGMTINVWDVQAGTMFRTFKSTISTIQCSPFSVAFSSCSTMIASGINDGTVRIWNINILSGCCDYVFQGHSGIVRNVCWLRNQVVSTSDDHTVCIWNVQKQTCSKIFAQNFGPVAALASSQDLLLVASMNGTVNIYDSQSGDIIHSIRSSNNMTHSCFANDGGKVLVASKNLGDIWDMIPKTLTHVRSINYIGDHATFSPDGTRIASIDGKFMKIWKTDTKYNDHEASTHVHDTIHDVYTSPDGQVVVLKSNKGAEILDATTGHSLFMYLVADFLSIGFSRDLAFVTFLLPHGTVKIWNTHTGHHRSIAIDNNVFHIALSPNGSQLASLSSFHMKLWDLESEGCLAHLKFDGPLQVEVRISFGFDGMSVSLMKNSGGPQSWRISPNHNIDDTKSWFTSHLLTYFVTQMWQPIYHNYTKNPINNHHDTMLPMVFVPTMEELSNQDVPMLCQSYHCDDEWILDEDERRILWIPPDERPRKFWCFKPGKKVIVRTESGKVYIVNFPHS